MLSYTKVNLFCYITFPGEYFVVFAFYEYGGGNIGSIATLIIFYSIDGITRPRTFPSTSIHGLELASIMNAYNLSSSIKSNPKSSKLNYFFYGFSFLPTE